MNDKNRVHPFLGRKKNKIRKYSMICSKPRKRHLQQSNFSKGFTKLAILPGYKTQYDKADLNKSQKSRPKTPTASKVIS